LLAEYNDGRKKTLFCLAVNLLPLKEQTVSLYSHSPEGRSAAAKAGYPESHQEDRGVTI
jgi:hypothetical protein